VPVRKDFKLAAQVLLQLFRAVHWRRSMSVADEVGIDKFVKAVPVSFIDGLRKALTIPLFCSRLLAASPPLSDA
jgi:hypothetical protein